MGKSATRDAYGRTLAEIGSDERIVVLDADLSKSTKTALFREKYPERHFNMGIAEGNMMSVAAGIASAGKIVFASSFAVFASGRAFEQIRNSICYPRMNVKIGASHSGITVGEDGATHQSVEDIAIMRALPNMTVLSPCDAAETAFCVRYAAGIDGPVYLRLGRLAVEDVYGGEACGGEAPFEGGKGVLLRNYGDDVTIFATGFMVQQSLGAAEILKAEGIGARVVDIFSIKPIDREIILKNAAETGRAVTVEEHSVIGGLGGAVAEVLSEECPVRLKRIGMEDTFGKSGTPAALLKRFGLDGESVARKVGEFVRGA